MRGWYRRLTVGLLVSGVLVSGCGGGGGSGAGDREERTEASRPEPPSGGDGANGADRYAPSEEGDEEDGAARDVAPSESPSMRSTFALDVDTASYGYARRTLKEGQLPSAETVRPEEFVNSFRQGYREPEGNGFSVSTDGARAGSSQWSLLRVGLATKGETAGEKKREPAALTFVVDVSGSMAEPGRLDLVKDSLRTMVGQLRAEDSVAIVTFSDTARTVQPMTRLGGDGQRAKVRAAIGELAVQGSTNLGEGVRLGYEEAVKGKRSGVTNRVVLLSDALANTGETNAEAILERVGEARREHGITLFGVGVGSDYGDSLMERLTNKGDGHTTYVSEREEAEKVFVQELPRNIAMRARDAKAQVAFEREAVEEFRLIGYDNRRVADDDFRNDRVDGGEVGPGHTVTALYAVRLKEGARGHVATATVRWLDPKTRAASEESGRVYASDLRGKLWGDSSPRLQVTAVAAYFADELRRARRMPDSPGLGELADRARSAADSTEDRAVEKLADAIEDARRLIGG